MRSNDCLDISARAACLSGVKGDNGFLPPIKEKCCSQPGDLDCKPALSCREAAQREYSRRDPGSQHRKEPLFRSDSPSLSLGLHRSLDMRPSKLPDIERSKCGGVGSMISVTPSSRGSKTSMTISNRLAMCKSPNCSQFDSWSDFNDSMHGFDNDKDVHTYSQTTRLKSVMDSVKLPEIVCARDNSIQETARKSISDRLAEGVSRKMASEGLPEQGQVDYEEASNKLDNESLKQVTSRTHGNTLLPIKINGVRKIKKTSRMESSKYWRSSDMICNTSDIASTHDESDHQTYQLSRQPAGGAGKTQTGGQSDPELSAHAHNESSLLGSGLALMTSSSTMDGVVIEKIAEENRVGKNTWN